MFVDECTGRKVVFLNRGEFVKIEEIHEHEFKDALSRMPDLVAQAYERARQRHEGELNCPACGSEMETREYAYCSQVMISKCIRCGGIWLTGARSRPSSCSTSENAQEPGAGSSEASLSTNTGSAASRIPDSSP